MKRVKNKVSDRTLTSQLAEISRCQCEPTSLILKMEKSIRWQLSSHDCLNFFKFYGDKISTTN